MINKKFVWKLIYIYILGYEVDFGHLEALNLINAAKYSEKCTGYIATGIMLNEMNADPELLEMVINSIQTDLRCGNEVYESLALSTIANIGASEFANSLGPAVQRLAFAEDYRPSYFIQKKACLCLYSFFKRNREVFNREVWADAFENELLTQKNYGLLLSACGLVHGTLISMGVDGFEGCVPKLIYILSRIHEYATDYLYYRTPSPWLQIKCLKILCLFPPPNDEDALSAINEYLINLVTGTEVGTNVNKNNGDHAILFEGIKLVIHYKDKAHEILRKDILALLGKFISVREANIRYLALETMARLSHNEVISSYLMREHMNTIIYSLRDPDASIRRRALDLIFALCDQDSATNVVNELLVYLNENDYSLKEELVLKIAILAEKFALNLNWYVDVIVKLITTEAAGDYVSDEMRFRVYQILTGFGESEPNFELQKYAALQIFLALQVDAVHETMVKLGASVLPEFGHHISDAPGKSYADQFDVLNNHFSISSASTKAMILSALMKFCLQDETCRDKAKSIFKRYSTSWDEDIQQRAIEYVKMLGLLEKDERYKSFIESSFDPLPTFPDHMQNNSILIKRMSSIKKKKGLSVTSKDKDAKDISEGAKEEYKSVVSSALSKSKSTDPSKKSATANDLLFGGDEVQQTTSKDDGAVDLLDLDMGGASIERKGALDHPFAKQNPGDFSSEQTVDLDSEADAYSLDYPQDSKWKTLIPGSVTDGTIYEDDSIKVNVKFNISKYLTRMLVEYVSVSASSLENIEAKLKTPDGILASVSSTKYPSNDTDNPKAMVMVMPTGNIKTELKMAIKYD
jgi:AP-2 complex subunit alpha